MAPSRAILSLIRSPCLPTRPHRPLALSPHPPRLALSTPALTPRSHQHQHRLLSTPASSPAVDLQGNALEPPDYLNEKELAIFEKLRRELAPERLEVQDISGGCGSMYAIEIVSARFQGMSMIRQHRLVNGVLGEEIRGWHGVQLKTRAS